MRQSQLKRPEIGWVPKRNPMTVTTRTVISDNAAGAISYFTFFPAIVFLLFPPFKESSYIRFHAWQSVLLAISAFSDRHHFGERSRF